MYNKAIEEIKEIFMRNGFFEIDLRGEEIRIRVTNLDKDLEVFLTKWEEGCIEANREAIEEQAIENYEPIRDESRD